MEYSKFRNADLIIMGILMIISGIVPLLLFNKASFEFYISFFMLIVYVTLIRWGHWAIFPIVVSEAIISVFQIMYFKMDVMLSIASNLVPSLIFVLLPFIFKKIEVREHILTTWLGLALIYVFYGAIQAMVVSLIQGSAYIPNLLFYLFNREFFSFVISCIVLVFLRKYDNLLVDVKTYLIRIKNVKEENDEWKGLEEDPQ